MLFGVIYKTAGINNNDVTIFFMDNKEPIETYEGGSIPVMSMLLKELGIHGAVLSFGLDDEQVHAPNEFFRLSSFTKAQIAYGSLLEEFKRI